MNKVGGLLKNLMNGELTDPKEIRSKVNGLLLDFSKQRINGETLSLLHALATAADLDGWKAYIAGPPPMV